MICVRCGEPLYEKRTMKWQETHCSRSCSMKDRFAKRTPGQRFRGRGVPHRRGDASDMGFEIAYGRRKVLPLTTCEVIKRDMSRCTETVDDPSGRFCAEHRRTSEAQGKVTR